MKNHFSCLSIAAVLLTTSMVQAQETTLSVAPENAIAHIIFPYNQQILKAGDVKVQFGLTGMGIAPAGIDVTNTGHHHLLINLDDDKLPDLTKPLPSNDQVKHFGKGQTETSLTLEPGQYSLQLVLANHLHVPHNPPVLSEKIIITVE